MVENASASGARVNDLPGSVCQLIILILKMIHTIYLQPVNFFRKMADTTKHDIKVQARVAHADKYSAKKQ